MKCCSNCMGFKDECIEGDGWCETRNKPPIVEVFANCTNGGMTALPNVA